MSENLASAKADRRATARRILNILESQSCRDFFKLWKESLLELFLRVLLVFTSRMNLNSDSGGYLSGMPGLNRSQNLRNPNGRRRYVGRCLGWWQGAKAGLLTITWKAVENHSNAQLFCRVFCSSAIYIAQCIIQCKTSVLQIHWAMLDESSPMRHLFYGHLYVLVCQFVLCDQGDVRTLWYLNVRSLAFYLRVESNEKSFMA